METKWFDTQTTATIAGSWATTAALNLVPQGTGQSQRVGRHLLIHEIQISGDFQLGATEDTLLAAAGNVYKLMLIMDTQANGAVPATTQIMTDTDIRSFMVPANEERFIILWQKVINIKPGAGAGIVTTEDWAGAIKHFEDNLEVDIPISFDGSTGAITEIRSNNLFWMHCAFTSNGTNSLFIRTRINYHD